MIAGLYREHPSWLHRVPAGLKLLAMAVSSTLLFAASVPQYLAPLSVACVGVYLSLWPVPAAARRPVVAALIAATVLAAFHSCLGHEWLGAQAALRLVAAACLGTSLTITTRFDAILRALERLLGPLERFGLRPGRLALMLALTIRFTEHFFVQWQKLDEAYRLRTGAAGGLKLLPPLCIQMLQAAQRTADALQARLGA